MNNARTTLSSWRIGNIRAQGYFHLSDEEIADLAFGNRLAYILCGALLTAGVTMAHIPILVTMATIAFASVLLPNHVFDYLYNYVVRHIVNKPELPPRSKQLKFACTIATLWIGATTYLFYTGCTVSAYVVGGMLLSVVFILLTTDFCLPSWIYNSIFPADSIRLKKQYQ